MRVLILDPEVAFAEALAALLSGRPDVSAADPVSTPGGVRAALATDHYDVLLVASDGSGYDAAEIVRWLSVEHPEVAVVALSSGASADDAATMLAAGALSWAPKHITAEGLGTVLELAGRGQASLPPEMLGPVIRSLAHSGSVAREAAELLSTLTPRERDVLEGMVEGLSRREIAERLFLSVNTVRTHIQHVLAKLHVHTALEAVAVAIQLDQHQLAAPATVETMPRQRRLTGS